MDSFPSRLVKCEQPAKASKKQQRIFIIVEMGVSQSQHAAYSVVYIRLYANESLYNHLRKTPNCFLKGLVLVRSIGVATEHIAKCSGDNYALFAKSFRQRRKGAGQLDRFHDRIIQNFVA